jgi:hypothetical protein
MGWTKRGQIIGVKLRILCRDRNDGEEFWQWQHLARIDFSPNQITQSSPSMRDDIELFRNGIRGLNL